MENDKIDYLELTRLLQNCEDLLTEDLHLQNPEKSGLLDKIKTIRHEISESGALRKADLYRLIIDEAPVGIVQYNSDGVITTCNSRFIKIIGSSAEKLLGLNMLELPDQDVVKAVRKSLQGKTGIYEGIYQSVTAAKSTPVRAKFTPIDPNVNSNQGGIGIVEDVTENFLALAALSESRSRYKTLFENNHSILLIVNPENGYIFDVNPAAETFYGIQRESFRNMSIFDLDTRSYNEVKNNLECVYSSADNIYEACHKLPDGETRQVEIAGGKIEFANQGLVYLIVHDISSRIQLEDNLRKFKMGLDRSSHPVFITDIDGNIQYINHAFEDLYGYTHDETIGKNPSLLKSGKQPASFYRDFWETILSGNVSSGEIINKTKSGDFVTVSYSSNPIINDQNEIIGFIAIHDNITERIMMEEEIRQSLFEKEILLSEIHHRVKNNLALVSSMLILQAETADNNDLKNKLNDSVNRIKAISNIHEQLYSTSNFATIDITDNTYKLIKNILGTLHTDTKIRIEKRSGPANINLNQAVYCSLIINEVVTNIIKHALKGLTEGTIGIKAELEEDSFTIVISDNGHPLPKDFQSMNYSSFGMELIHILTRQLEGAFRYKSDSGETHFILNFKKSNKRKGHFD